jgi:hypothetical protein
MFGCVLVRRAVAAANVAAFKTEPQVNPSAVHLETLLASIGSARLDVMNLIEMSAA